MKYLYPLVSHMKHPLKTDNPKMHSRYKFVDYRWKDWVKPYLEDSMQVSKRFYTQFIHRSVAQTIALDQVFDELFKELSNRHPEWRTDPIPITWSVHCLPVFFKPRTPSLLLGMMDPTYTDFSIEWLDDQVVCRLYDELTGEAGGEDYWVLRDPNLASSILHPNEQIFVYATMEKTNMRRKEVSIHAREYHTRLFKNPWDDIYETIYQYIPRIIPLFECTISSCDVRVWDYVAVRLFDDVSKYGEYKKDTHMLYNEWLHEFPKIYDIQNMNKTPFEIECNIREKGCAYIE